MAEDKTEDFPRMTPGELFGGLDIHSILAGNPGVYGGIVEVLEDGSVRGLPMKVPFIYEKDKTRKALDGVLAKDGDEIAEDINPFTRDKAGKATAWEQNTVEPEDRTTCSIYIDRGMACSVIIVGVAYFKDAKGFLDILASADAGSVYLLKDVAAWTLSENIPEPPDDYFERRKNRKVATVELEEIK